MNKCRGCEAFPKCTAKNYGDTTCNYLRYTYGQDEAKPMTNADRIRAMTDEDYAKIAANHIPLHAWPDAVRDIYFKSHVSKFGAWLEWLQQPVKGDAE